MITIERYITELVKDRPLIKGTEIVCVAVPYALQNDLDYENLPNILNAMVRAGQIKEIEYVETAMSYRIKSMYYSAKFDAKIQKAGEGDNAIWKIDVGTFSKVMSDLANIQKVEPETCPS